MSTDFLFSQCEGFIIRKNKTKTKKTDDNITIQNKFQIFHMFAVHNEEREKQTAQKCILGNNVKYTTLRYYHLYNVLYIFYIYIYITNKPRLSKDFS